MTQSSIPTIDPNLDLVLERTIDAPIALVWSALTKPEHIVKWFVPAPWTITACEIDLRPGGIFRTVMRSPEGQEFPNAGCFLEIVPQERLVWTDALQPGWRPSENPFFTAIVTLDTQGGATRYIARAIHRDVATRSKHEEMGFHQGWGTCIDQLNELVKTL